MSTRATYRIAGGFDNKQARTTFYIHHDGYFAGAAMYFNLMLLKWPTSKGGYAEAFLRANDGAELTGGHYSHGDTEYQYTLEADGHLVVRAARYTNGGKVWIGVYVGSVWQFINGNPSLIEGFQPWVQVAPCRWMTQRQVEVEVERRRTSLADYRARFPQYTGNIAGMERDLVEAECWLATVKAATTTPVEG